MTPTIRITPTAPGTSDWRAERTDTGRALCDIRLNISSMLNASRYYVIIDGEVRREGTFNFDLWDAETIRDVLTQIVQKLVPGAQVEVDLRDGGMRKTA